MPLRPGVARRDSTSSSECSDNSYHSQSTAPTVYSVRPSLRHYETDVSQIKADHKWEEPFFHEEYARSSVGTYASTEPSEADFNEDEPIYEEPPEYHYENPTPTVYASTPPQFADYFPSTKRLRICHDDTIDGNMNLRIDTDMQTSSGRRVDLTLFHLRMHDLKNRQFSLRRYCRDSGREVCHSSRKYAKLASERRPGLQRSVSNAFASLMSKSDGRTATKTSLKRNDSGYESMSEDEDDDTLPRESPRLNSTGSLPMPTNTTKVEFSNYAHVDLKRRGAKSSKRYEFEYWGTSYAWRRVVKKHGPMKVISYHLYNLQASTPVAHIVPIPMTPAEAFDEERKGGWVPPSSLWISDERILSGLTDVAE